MAEVITREYIPPRKKRTWIWIITIILFFMVAGGVGVAVWKSSFFKVALLSAEGVEKIPEERFIEAVAEDIEKTSWWKGKLGRDHIFFWYANRDSLQPPSSFSYLASVSLAVDALKREVRLVAHERELYGVWCITPRARCYGFDKEGVVFSETPLLQGALFIKVDDTNDNSFLYGQTILPSEWINGFLNTLKVVREADVLARQIVVRDVALKEWSMVTSKGKTLLFSFLSPFEGDSETLKNVINTSGHESATEYDFRVAGRVFIR